LASGTPRAFFRSTSFSAVTSTRAALSTGGRAKSKFLMGAVFTACALLLSKGRF
jgi:hypothetical protein